MGGQAESPGLGPLTSGDHLNGHADLASPEPLKDLPEVAGPQLPAERELLPGSLPVGTEGQGLALALRGQAGVPSCRPALPEGQPVPPTPATGALAMGPSVQGMRALQGLPLAVSGKPPPSLPALGL